MPSPAMTAYLMVSFELISMPGLRRCANFGDDSLCQHARSGAPFPDKECLPRDRSVARNPHLAGEGMIDQGGAMTTCGCGRPLVEFQLDVPGRPSDLSAMSTLKSSSRLMVSSRFHAERSIRCAGRGPGEDRRM